jgi:hypothetical protein
VPAGSLKPPATPTLVRTRDLPLKAPHGGLACQERVVTWPGDLRPSGWVGCLFGWLSSQLPDLVPLRGPWVKLERPQPRSGEDERA